jgi:hypothetical protein
MFLDGSTQTLDTFVIENPNCAAAINATVTLQKPCALTSGLKGLVINCGQLTRRAEVLNLYIEVSNLMAKYNLYQVTFYL